MKALAGLFVVAFAVFLMFAVVGQPSYSGSDGSTLTYGGLTLFDSWNMEAQQKTERIRIAEAQETARITIEQEESTKRNAAFWQMFPYVMLSLSAVCAAVGLSFVGFAMARRPVQPPAPRITYNVRNDWTANISTAQPVADLEEWNPEQGLPPLPPIRRITVSRR